LLRKKREVRRLIGVGKNRQLRVKDGFDEDIFGTKYSFGIKSGWRDYSCCCRFIWDLAAVYYDN